MPRPRCRRNIGFAPGVTYFKPQGVSMRKLEQVDLGLDELEAVRLKYLNEKDNEGGAKEMKISSSTFQRIVVSGLKKIAEALVDGKAIKIYLTQNNMPGFDKTGPRGQGVCTGKGLGPCMRGNATSEVETLKKQLAEAQDRIKELEK